MTNSTRTGIALLLLVPGLAGCGDSPSPVAPTPPSDVNSPVNGGELIGELINGTVHDSALRPLAGARVELIDGPQAGRSTTSRDNGEFSLTGTVDDTTRFRAIKEGHVTATATILPICDRCNPKRWVHFYLSPLNAPVALAGDYTLTFTAESTCANLPDELRTRTYAATIAPENLSWPGFPAQPDTSFKLTPTGSAFPEGLNGFYLNVAGNYVALSLGDHTDPGITERVTANTYFAFGGSAALSVDSPVHTIDTAFTGWIDYCVNPQMGERYDCSPGPAVTLARCESSTHRLRLTRR